MRVIYQSNPHLPFATVHLDNGMEIDIKIRDGKVRITYPATPLNIVNARLLAEGLLEAATVAEQAVSKLQAASQSLEDTAVHDDTLRLEEKDVVALRNKVHNPANRTPHPPADQDEPPAPQQDEDNV